MHCVYDAFEAHMLAIGEKSYMGVWDEYLKQKRMSHDDNPNQDTFAGIVPWLYWNMLFQHNLRSPSVVEMKLERTYVTLPEYMPDAQNQIQREIVFQRTRYWGREVDKITLEPAIYCMLSERHAQYVETIPTFPGARIILAFQFIVAHKTKEKDE